MKINAYFTIRLFSAAEDNLEELKQLFTDIFMNAKVSIHSNSIILLVSGRFNV